jgi:prepilin-type N-terminal cleavage/methylation domain-containing protein
MNLVSQLKFSRGFTVLELMTVIFIITVGIVGVSSLITQTISLATLSSQKLTAIYLAQEGIEIVRNIRDKNWVVGESWNNGLVLPQIDCSSGCEADYNDQGLSPYSGTLLKLETGTGFYGYDIGSPTQFKRKITITQPGADILKVLVLVEWQVKTKTYSVSAQENLYNWR